MDEAPFETLKGHLGVVWGVKLGVDFPLKLWAKKTYKANCLEFYEKLYLARLN